MVAWFPSQRRQDCIALHSIRSAAVARIRVISNAVQTTWRAPTRAMSRGVVHDGCTFAISVSAIIKR
jgi:hypothetical protein